MPNICAAVIALGLMRRMTCLISVSDKASARTSRAQVLPMVTSSLSGITAREPQQNPVLVFSITLTHERVRPPVWIILYFTLNLPSVRALPVKGLDHNNLPSTHELVLRCAFSVACTHTNKNQKKRMRFLTITYRRRAHAHTHTHTHKHQHRNTCTTSLPLVAKKNIYYNRGCNKRFP